LDVREHPSKGAVMKEVIEQQVNTSSSEFKEGVEAGLNSPADTRNWQAGNDLGQALKDETGKETPMGGSHESTAPLFMRSSTERNQGNAQDEKDETEE
jgi:hypothetical protein